MMGRIVTDRSWSAQPSEPYRGVGQPSAPGLGRSHYCPVVPAAQAAPHKSAGGTWWLRRTRWVTKNALPSTPENGVGRAAVRSLR